jgi:hypothetical protein
MHVILLGFFFLCICVSNLLSTTMLDIYCNSMRAHLCTFHVYKKGCLSHRSGAQALYHGALGGSLPRYLCTLLQQKLDFACVLQVNDEPIIVTKNSSLANTELCLMARAPVVQMVHTPLGLPCTSRHNWLLASTISSEPCLKQGGCDGYTPSRELVRFPCSSST